MKKAIAIFLCVAVLALPLVGCGKDNPANITFTGMIEEVLDNAIVVSTTDAISFDRARVGFAPECKIGFNFLVGQQVKVTILPQIAESYPVQVTAVAIDLIAEPAASDPGRADYTARFLRADSIADGGWEKFILPRASNPQTLAISSVRHIPVVPIADAAALKDFVEAGRAYYQLDQSYGGDGSFADAAKAYDAAFFAENVLLILSVQERSGSIRHRIADTPISGTTLSVAVETIVPEEMDTAMADWLIVLEIPREEISGCDAFDAFYQ